MDVVHLGAEVHTFQDVVIEECAGAYAVVNVDRSKLRAIEPVVGVGRCAPLVGDIAVGCEHTLAAIEDAALENLDLRG